MRAAILARVSTTEQAAGDRHSMPFQLSLMTEYVAAKGWELSRTFEIPGESAYRDYIAERPQFGAAIDCARRGEFDVLVVYDLSRFARNQAVLHETLRDLRHAGVRLMVWSGDWDATEDRTRAGLEGIIAESHSVQHSARVKHAFRRRFEMGLPVGDVPFGYVRAAGPSLPPVVVEAEAEAIRWGFEAYARGSGYQAIASEWNRRGLQPHSKRGLTGFTLSAVQSVVENRFYVGVVTHHGEEGAGAHEAVITEEQWLAAHSRVRRQGSHQATGFEAQFQGLMVCSLCGGPVWSHRRGPQRRHYYWEPSRVRGRECEAAGLSWRCDEVDAEVSATLSGLRFEGEWFEYVSRLARKEPSRVDVGRLRASLLAEKRRVSQVYVAGAMDERRWVSEMARVDGELTGLPVAEPARLLEAGRVMGEFAEAWGEWTAAERNEVSRLLLASVRVDVRWHELGLEPREEFREVFGARRSYVRMKALGTPAGTRTSLVPSGGGVFDLADLRVAS